MNERSNRSVNSAAQVQSVRIVHSPRVRRLPPPFGRTPAAQPTNMFCQVAFVALGLSASAAHAFNVSVYKLGMTQAQAVKVGASGCKRIADTLRCIDGVVAFDASSAVTVDIDARSKRVIEVRVEVPLHMVKKLDDDRLYRELRMDRCKPGYEKGPTCYSRPYNMRVAMFVSAQKFKPAHYLVYASSNRQDARVFFIDNPALR